MRGRLDQRARCFHVEDALTRDIQKEQLGDIIQSLSSWLSGAHQVLGGIDAQVGNVVASTAAVDKRREDLENEIESARAGVRAVLESKAAQDSAAMAMDEGDVAALLSGLVEGDGRPSGRNTKRRR